MHLNQKALFITLLLGFWQEIDEDYASEDRSAAIELLPQQLAGVMRIGTRASPEHNTPRSQHWSAIESPSWWALHFHLAGVLSLNDLSLLWPQGVTLYKDSVHPLLMNSGLHWFRRASLFLTPLSIQSLQTPDSTISFHVPSNSSLPHFH